jgi:limonene-1,2-epoxide hydrolase
VGAQQEDVVLRLLRLFHSEDIAGQLDEIAACLSAGATYQPVVPLAQLRQGRDAIVEELRGQAGRYKNCICDVQVVASTDSIVFTERTDTVTMLSDLKQVVVRVVGVFEVDARGQVSAWREYWDNAAVAQQIGIPVETMPTVSGSVASA